MVNTTVLVWWRYLEYLWHRTKFLMEHHHLTEYTRNCTDGSQLVPLFWGQHSNSCVHISEKIKYFVKYMKTLCSIVFNHYSVFKVCGSECPTSQYTLYIFRVAPCQISQNDPLRS